METATYDINQAGLELITQKLNESHKSFQDIPLDVKLPLDRKMVLTWAADAEERANEGSTPSIELSQYVTLSGRTEELYLDLDEHFTKQASDAK